MFVASDPVTNFCENQFPVVTRPDPDGELLGREDVGMLEGSDEGCTVGKHEGIRIGCKLGFVVGRRDG